MTESEPRIHWRPWETRPEEEARVQRQVEEVEGEILREVEDFEETKRRWAGEDEEKERMDDEHNMGSSRDANGKGRMRDVNSTTDGAVEGHVDGEEVEGTRPSLTGSEAQVSQSQVTQKPGQEQAQHGREAERRQSVDDLDDAAIDAGEDTLVF